MLVVAYISNVYPLHLIVKSKDNLKKSSVHTKFWSKKNLVPKRFRPPKIGYKSLVKIKSVTAEIFLIWTNVARTNIVWTNVTVTDSIC